ncbi:transcription initiation TFIID-like, putative [Plasmodium ovale curtisi]|uniref:Transcription initiation TFIID-like, putative n=1 Tax=Plasmodium ovale curtisi TaxID=864141 RepID=A0A1A8WUK0_PLAOA|nr:transcription initiation TFIID-like, putative [Plasmodium ovale curtisi]
MNAILCSSLNLDSIYKHFSNCVYNPREFKCMRIDVPVSLSTVNKYVNHIKNKEKLQTEKNQNEVCMAVENDSNKSLPTQASNTNFNINIEPNNYYPPEMKYIDGVSTFEDKNDEDDYTSEKLVINVSIFSNGKIICTGNNSIEACKIAMKKVEKKLKQLNFKNIKLKKIAITNILAVDYDPNVFPACKVKIALTNDDNNNSSEFNEQNDSSYAWCTNRPTIETSKSKADVVSASIFSTGNITLTGGKSYDNLKRCIDILLPYLIKSRSQH